MLLFFYNSLYFFLLWTAFCVSVVRNPVFAAIYLIGMFCLGSIVLLFFGIFEYIAVLYVIVYVGAVAVLFLFVIMMLEVRLLEERYSSLTMVPLLLIMFLVFVFQLFFFFFFSTTDAFIDINNVIISYQMLLMADSTNLVTISSAFFSVYGFLLILCSFLLLFGMLSAILIALVEQSTLNKQNFFEQSIRSAYLRFFSFN